MPQRRESFRDVHVDRPLTNISCAYFQDDSVFVSGKFFPTMNVMKASDTFDVYPQGYWNRVYDTTRGEESVANSVTYKVSKDSYSVGDDALRIFISDKKRANTDSQRRLDMEATKLVTQAIALGKENQFADTFMQADTWATNYVGTDKSGTGDFSAAEKATGKVRKWSDVNANPMAQVKEACKAVFLASGGRRCNKMIITYDVWIALTENKELVDRVKYMGTNTNPGMVTKQAVAALFELDDILVMSSIANMAGTSIEKKSTTDDSFTVDVDNQFLASGTVLLGHVPSSVGLMTPCNGITFQWQNYVRAASDGGPSIRRYRPMDGRKGEYIEAELSIDQKLVSKDMGALWTGMV